MYLGHVWFNGVYVLMNPYSCVCVDDATHEFGNTHTHTHTARGTLNALCFFTKLGVVCVVMKRFNCGWACFAYAMGVVCS